MNDTPSPLPGPVQSPLPGPVQGAGSSGTPPTVLIVLAVIALLALTVLWAVFKGYLRAKAAQHIFYRQDHRDGRRLVAEQVRFTLRAPLPSVMDAVIAAMQVVPAIPTAAPAVYVKDASPDRIVFGYGSALLRKNFTAILDLAANGGLTSGTWQITNWTTTNGVVDCVSAMRRLRASLDAALTGLDPGHLTQE